MAESTETVFKCRQCGACCRTAGFVHLQDGEASALSAHLSQDVLAFTERFTVLASDRRGLVLKDKPDGSCILLDAQGRCLVHDVKPRQCRGFPFSWQNPDSATLCPGLKAN
jgi:hypothetical protein